MFEWQAEHALPAPVSAIAMGHHVTTVADVSSMPYATVTHSFCKP